MKKLFAMTVLTAVTLTMTTAGAKPGDPPLKRERAKYLNLYFAVKHKEGKRAPGRQILRQGVRHKHGVRPATAKEVARSIRQLRILLNPMLVARPPAQAPAAVQSARAGATLDAIAQCESGGSYTAVDPTGTYTGRYQFDDQTWHSVGGTGRAGNASPAEQDMRAAMLYRERGSAPWPVCGR